MSPFRLFQMGSGSVFRASKSMARKGKPLRMEALEPREMLAGDVTAVVVSNSLIVEGDSADNDYEVSVSAAGEVQVVGRNGTTINGASDPYIPWAGVGQIPGDLRISNLSGGNNHVRVLGIEVGDDIAIYGGFGSDDIAVLDSAAADKLNVLANGGNDTIRIGGTLDRSVASSRSTYVNLGWDGASLGIANMEIVRDLNIVSVRGDNHIALSNSSVGDDVNIRAGSGDDVVAIHGSEVSDQTTIKPGAGDNTVAVDGSLHHGLVNIRTSWGNDFIAIRDSDFGYRTYVQASYGVDQVGIVGSNFADYAYASGGSKFDTIEVGDDNVFAMEPRVRKFEAQGISDFHELVDQVFAELGDEGLMAPRFATIGEIATTNPNFQTLRTALELTSLMEVVNTARPLTVFAPTDTAFANLDPVLFNNLIADPTRLANVLLYHVAFDELLAAEVVTMPTIPTALGPVIDVSINGDVKLNGTSTVGPADVLAANGVIHVIDEVLIPPSP